jgi:hypothetical protein
MFNASSKLGTPPPTPLSPLLNYKKRGSQEISSDKTKQMLEMNIDSETELNRQIVYSTYTDDSSAATTKFSLTTTETAYNIKESLSLTIPQPYPVAKTTFDYTHNPSSKKPEVSFESPESPKSIDGGYAESYGSHTTAYTHTTSNMTSFLKVRDDLPKSVALCRSGSFVVSCPL